MQRRPMDAVGDEKRIEPGHGGPCDVRYHAVADRQHAPPVQRRAERVFSQSQGAAIDRRIGLAGVDDRTAEVFISTSQRSGAVDEDVAAMDHDVRIGANHGHGASRHVAELGFVVAGRLGHIVPQPGAKRIACVFQGHEVRPAARRLSGSVEKAEVALGPDVEDGIADPFGNQIDRDVARGRNGVKCMRRDAEPLELAADRRGRPWRVADQNHRAAAPAKGGQSV